MSGRGLRYASLESMPDGMRRAAEKAVAKNAPALPIPEKGDARRKYGNCPVTVDGIRFDSKREARYYEHLKILKDKGEVSYWLRQVPLHMPGGTRYVLDFLVFYPHDPPAFIDVKGRETQVFRIKKREIEHHYPIRIQLV